MGLYAVLIWSSLEIQKHSRLRAGGHKKSNIEHLHCIHFLWGNSWDLCTSCNSQLTTALAAWVPGGSVSLMPRGGVALMTLIVQPVFRLMCCTEAERLRSCACSSYSSAACTWSSVSASAWRTSRKRSRWSVVVFKVTLSSSWEP